MIGFVVEALRTRILLPQTLPAVDGDHRIVIDLDDTEMTLGGAEVDVAGATTTPVSRDIGGGGILRHTVVLALTVLDGDLTRATLRRDAIMTDLVMRLEADLMLGGVASADGRQEIGTPARWSADYADVISDTPASYATLTVVLDADLR